MSAATQARSKPVPPPTTTARPALAVSNGKTAPTATKPLPSVPAVPVAATPTTTATKPRTAPIPAPTLAKPSLTSAPSSVDLNLSVQATPKPSAAPQLVSSTINNDKTKARIAAPAPPTQLLPAVTPKASDMQMRTRIKPSFPPGMSTPMTPSAPTAVRSYSEIVKSEEALNQLLIRKNQELKDMRDMMMQRDSRMNALEAEISTLKDALATTQTEAENRLRDTMALHSQQYKELNTSFLNLSTKSAALENKLEECGINPISLRPWDIDEEDQVAIDAEQAEIERLAREIEETYAAKSKQFEAIQEHCAALEASLPELLEEPPSEADLEEVLTANLDNLDYEMMQIMKEMGLHESTPLGDVTEEFNGHPSDERLQEFAEDYIEADQQQEEQEQQSLADSGEIEAVHDTAMGSTIEEHQNESSAGEDEEIIDEFAEDKENL